MDLLAPDHQLGHTEAQVRALLGDEYVRFSEHILMKAPARDENGFVFYDVDLRWYFSAHNERDPVRSPRSEGS